MATNVGSVDVTFTSVMAKKCLEKIRALQKVEYHLRRKCKRYRRHVKVLHRGIAWRNELIFELLQRLGYFDETVVLSPDDFKKLLDNIGEVEI
jgi:uncharacterized membrane protein YgaE (UPF0421/DUF939 family)